MFSYAAKRPLLGTVGVSTLVGAAKYTGLTSEKRTSIFRGFLLLLTSKRGICRRITQERSRSRNSSC